MAFGDILAGLIGRAGGSYLKTRREGQERDDRLQQQEASRLQQQGNADRGFDLQRRQLDVVLENSRRQIAEAAAAKAAKAAERQRRIDYGIAQGMSPQEAEVYSDDEVGFRQRIAPKEPKAAPVPEWEQEGFKDEPSYLAFLRRKTGATTRETGSGSPSQGKVLPVSAIERVEMLRDLAKAARNIPAMLDSAKGNQTGPIVGRIPGWARNIVAPGSVSLQSLISSIQAQYMNLLSGAAVSPSEAARLKPFVPGGDDDEVVVRQKAVDFADRLDEIRAAREAAFKRAGYNAGGDHDPMQDPLDDLSPTTGGVIQRMQLEPPPKKK